MTRSPFKHLVTEKDRHGNVRRYVRIPGHRKIRIREQYLDENGCVTEEFTRAYRRALDKMPINSERKEKIVKTRDTFEWLVNEYYRSTEFQELYQTTKKQKIQTLRKFRSVAGRLPYKKYRQEDVIRSRDKRKDTPAAADIFVKIRRRLFNWAIENKLATSNPTYKVAKINRSSGWKAWSQAELCQYREFYPLGTLERLAIELLDGLGTRRSDTALVGPQHIDRGCLVFIAYKGRRKQPTEVVVSIPPRLQEALDATETGDTTFLIKPDGTSFGIEEFGRVFKQWCVAAGLPHCYAHGVRRALPSITQKPELQWTN